MSRSRQPAPFPALAPILLLVLALALLAWPASGQHHGGHDGQHGQHGQQAGGAATDEHAAHRAMMRQEGQQDGADCRAEAVDGLSIPDVTVRDQDGREHRFYSDLVAGRTVAMNFVFTTCTTICPPMGANFGRLQEELGERLGDDVHLISVSVDPVTDTPPRLKAWGEKFGARPGWTLVTGQRSDIEDLLKALEVFNADIREHSPVVLIGDDERGEWTRAYGLAGPAELAQIVDRVQGDKTRQGGKTGEGGKTGQGDETGHGDHGGHGHDGRGER